VSVPRATKRQWHKPILARPEHKRNPTDNQESPTEGNDSAPCRHSTDTAGIMATLSFSQSMFSGHTVTVSARTAARLLLWSARWSGTLCWTISGILMLIAIDNFKRLLETFFFQCTSAISTLDMLQRCALHTYILLTYFLTYLLTYLHYGQQQQHCRVGMRSEGMMVQHHRGG